MHILFSNKKLHLNYFVLEKYECGIELKGYEVKSIVKANANIDQSYVIFRNDEAYLINMYVAPYNEAGKWLQLPPERTRKLLLHKHEILKLQYKVKKEKAAIIPNLVYLSKDKIKVEICLCKSKKDHDKREDIKKRDNQREMKKYY